MCEFLLTFLNPRKKSVKGKKGILFKECCKDKVTDELDLKVEEFTREMNWVNFPGTENSITKIIQDLKSTAYLRLSQ